MLTSLKKLYWKIRYWYRSRTRRHVVYLCGVDYQHELGEIPTKVYESVETLKEESKCWESCGIVELEVKLKRWVEPQDLWRFSKTSKESENEDKD